MNIDHLLWNDTYWSDCRNVFFRGMDYILSLEYGYLLFSNPTTWKKSKAVPLQALAGPQGSRSSRLPDF
jgi:hypothetical protein